MNQVARARPPRMKRAKAPSMSTKAQASVAAAYATGQSGKGARVTASRESCRVVHREFVANLTGSATFTVANTFAVNPGVAATFPWLSGIAQNWETYRFRYLRLCYYTRTGSNIPGSVIMAHDPDSSDAAPVSEQVMTTYEACEEDAPWKDICLQMRSLALHDLGPRKFVRTGALAANQDIKLYDSGNVFVATVDGTAVSWGKLWLEYDVEFYTPQLPPAGVPALSGSLVNPTGAGITTGALVGTNQVAAGVLALSCPAAVLTVSNLTVGGTYLLNFFFTSSLGATVTQAVTSGATLKNALAVATASAGGYGISSGSAVLTFVATATVATFTYTQSTTTGTSGSGFLCSAIAPTGL